MLSDLLVPQQTSAKLLLVSLRGEIGRLSCELAHCAYVPLLKAFEILSLNLIRQQFTADSCHIPALLTVILKVHLQNAWFWFVTPISTAATSAKPCIYSTVHMMLLLWIWQETLSDLGRPGPQIPAWLGAACCARQRRDERFAKGGFISPQSCPHAAAGRGPVQLLASFLTIQGGSDLCLAPVALQGLSHTGTSLISWPSPTISTQAWFWAEK